MDAKRFQVWVLAAALAAWWTPIHAAPADAMCADCHGKDGASTESDVPVIGGLSEQYVKDALTAYKDKKRACPESKYRSGDTKRPKTDMCQIAAKLSDDDVAKIAKDLAGEPFVKVRQKFDAAQAANGKKLHDQSCEKCHSKGGAAADDDAGILAGQWTPYLKAQLADMLGGKRVPPEKMKPKIEALKPADVDALLGYYASQQ